MHNTYDPAKTAGQTEFRGCMSDHCMVCGPSGNSTLTNQNEKAILETGVHMHTSPPAAVIRSDHDSYKQGVYTTNSVGDFD